MTRRLGVPVMSRRALTAIGTIGPFGTEGMAVAALVGVAVLVAATPTVVGVPLLPLAGLGCIGIAAWGYRRHRMGRFLPAGVGPVDPGLLLLAAIAGQACGWVMGAGAAHPSVVGQVVSLASYPFAAIPLTAGS